MVASIIPKKLFTTKITGGCFNLWQRPFMQSGKTWIQIIMSFFNQKSSITLGLKTKPKQKPMPSSMEKLIL